MKSEDKLAIWSAFIIFIVYARIFVGFTDWNWVTILRFPSIVYLLIYPILKIVEWIKGGKK